MTTRAPADAKDLSAPLPVTVIGGYLGAGKTTLVNHLLRHAAGRHIAVAVNEFGALPIDQDLIVGAEGNVLTLAGGCICCTFGSDLVAGLMDLAKKRDSLDHILIEASGVALPGAIAQSVSLVQGLALDSIVVVADAETVRVRASDPYMADTITRQLADADIVLLNKIDLAASPESVGEWLAPLAVNARVLPITHGRVAPGILLGIGTQGIDSAFDPHAPRAPHNAQALEAAVFELRYPVDADVLAAALAARDVGLVRAKGFVEDPSRGSTLIQVVGRRHTTSKAECRRVETRTLGRLVCITHGRPIQRDAIEAAINSARVKA